MEKVDEMKPELGVMLHNLYNFSNLMGFEFHEIAAMLYIHSLKN